MNFTLNFIQVIGGLIVTAIGAGGLGGFLAKFWDKNRIEYQDILAVLQADVKDLKREVKVLQFKVARYEGKLYQTKEGTQLVEDTVREAEKIR